MNSKDNDLNKHFIEINGCSFSGFNVPLKSVISHKSIKSEIIKRGREKYGNERVGVIVQKYYDNMLLIEQERKNGNLEVMKVLCEESLEMIEALIIDSKELYGTFDLTKIPAIERLFKIQSFKDFLEEFPELQNWENKLVKIQSK
jgi:hypothetical protein